MNPSDEWQQQPGDPRSRERAPGDGNGMQPPNYGYGPNGFPNPYTRKKSKWVSAFLSLLVPGTGHMYLGLMTKGIAIMLLLALNICAVVYFAVEYNGSSGGSSVLTIVLVSLLIPILYFYNLFDALQQTEMLNERYSAGWPGASGWNGMPHSQGGQQKQQQQIPVAGVLLLAAGGVALFSVANTDWTRWLLHSSGSMVGAVILLVIGGLVWLWERRGSSGRKE